MNKYIVSGRGYYKKAKGVIYTNAKWKDVIKIAGNGSYIVFENKMNNFNKVSGKIAMEKLNSSEKETRWSLVVYDKEKFDKEILDEFVYSKNYYSHENIIDFTFTFDRSIKNLVFLLVIDGIYTNRSIFLKDLKYGFSKTAYRDELERKREEEEDILFFKSLGIYVEEDGYFELIDEDGELIDEEIEEDEIEEIVDTEELYQRMLDKKTGPAFDEELKELNINIPLTPYKEIIEKKGEGNKKTRKSKIIYSQ